MSGTSVDGIDAALVSIPSQNSITVVETLFTPFQDKLRNQINALAQTNWNIHGQSLTKCSDSELHHQLAQNYADASLALLRKANIKPSQVCAIANHGQTVRHEPNATPPFSLQLGDAQLIANKTGIRTIGQFRQADLAAGGQGAPLMPAFHQAVFQYQGNKLNHDNTFALNIGGIANISQLGNKVTGFDTGPGNTLLDQWILRHQGLSYDKNGSWAASGKTIIPLLDALLDTPYFSAPHPKSTGPDYFNLKWLESLCTQASIDLECYVPQDVQATLLSLTVKTISNSIRELMSDNTSAEVFICGGGAHNTAMLKQLSAELPKCVIKTTDAVGIPADWVEAAGFAWLGYCHQHNINSNLPEVTGAKQQVVLGESFEPE